MNRKTISFLYRNTFILIAFLIPSAAYGLIWAVLLLTFICWIYFKDYTKISSYVTQPQILWPLLLYTMVIGGFFFADDFHESLSTLSTKLPILVFPLVFGTASVVNSSLIYKAGKSFVLSIFLFLAIALGYALFDVFKSGQQFISINGDIYYKFKSYGLTRVFENWHPTYVAMFANMAIAILIDKYTNPYGKLSWAILIIDFSLMLFFIISIILLDSIIALIAFIILLIYFGMIFLSKYNFTFLSKTALFLFLCTAVGLLFYFNPLKTGKIETLKDRGLTITDKEGERNVLTIRLAKWDTHLFIIKKHLLFGTTEGDIKTIRREAYETKGYYNLAKLNYNAHNQFIEVLATYGIVGFIFFLALLFHPLFKKNYHPYFAPFLLVAITTFLTETVLNRQQGILGFMFLYALYTHSFPLKKKIEA